MKLGIDAMSGDLGSEIVVEACLSFLEKNKTDELYVVGKIEELSSAVLPEYTIEGNLLGHISIMSARVDRVAHQLNIQDKESVMLIKHMILSHHGKMEFGSPVLPMIPEAEVLSLVDNLDARIVMMKNSLDQTVPGEFGPRVFALENRMIYHRKGSK